MAKYTSDTNLIRGAAAVGQSMLPTDLSGLDKVTQAGMGVMDEAVKGYEAEQAKIKKEAREAQAKADKLNDNWNTLASGVYESAGSFMKDVEYKDTIASVKALRQEYIDAQNSKDAEKMAEVKIKFNNINTEVAAHKEFRALLTHPEYGMSDFVEGDKLEYMNKFIDEDYVIGRNDKGEKTYTIDGVSKTMEQINKMVGVKNMKPYGDYGKLVNDFSTSKTKGNRNNLLLSIRNGIVPDQENPLRAFLNDKGFGNGQTFSDLLSETGNRASIEKEIMGGAFDNEEDSKGVITEDEYNNFINAIVSPDNKFWKNNGGASAWKDQSRTIATELLANGAENAWDNNPDNKLKGNDVDGGDDKPLFNPNMYYPLGTQGGSSTGGQINGWINDIKTGSSFDFDGNGFDYVDGGWYVNYNDGLGEEERSTPDSENYIGDAETLIASVFGAGGGDARFNDITTKKIKIIDPKSGKEKASKTDDEKIENKVFANIFKGNDASSAAFLNTQFDLDKRTGKQIYFKKYSDPASFGASQLGINDAPGDDVMLVGPDGVIRDSEGEIIRFKSGSNESEADIKQSVSDILKKLKELGIETLGDSTTSGGSIDTSGY
tara:strand:+ start:316 stop:2124 length:1809 start_codon:yes stop_codon:yes gene_type:complete